MVCDWNVRLSAPDASQTIGLLHRQKNPKRGVFICRQPDVIRTFDWKSLKEKLKSFDEILLKQDHISLAIQQMLGKIFQKTFR
jgi:hypothetical protein